VWLVYRKIYDYCKSFYGKDFFDKTEQKSIKIVIQSNEKAFNEIPWVLVVCFTIPVDYMEPNQNTNIIKNYKKFFGFVFTYLFLLLALVLAGFFFKKIFINTPVVATINDTLELQKIKLVGTFEKLLNHTVQDNDVQVYILQ
jgi:hypothetical protein